MYRSGKAAFICGLFAALFWSPHFRMVQRIRAAEVSPPLLVLSFYVLLGAAAFLILLLFLAGKLSELDVFRRRETRFLILAATGGYGFWVFRALALERADASMAFVLFAATPVAIGVFSAFGREKASGGGFVGLLLGFVGCIMLSSPADRLTGGLPAVLLGAGAATCWAVFSLAARPLARQEKALPTAAVVTGIGAACLLVTCLSTGESIGNIQPAQAGLALALGAVTVGLMTTFWLKCLAGVPAVVAAPLWYVGVLLGTIWGVLGMGEPRPKLWWLFGAAVLIGLGLHSAWSGRGRRRGTLSDIIRSS